MALMGALAAPTHPLEPPSPLYSYTFKFRLGVEVELPGKSTGNVHWGPSLVFLKPREWFINRLGVSGAGMP